MRLSLLLFFSCCSVVVVFSAHSRVSNIIYNAISILSVAVMNTTISAEPGNRKVIYISLGATSAILLFSIPVFAWCYRRTKLKNSKRLM